VWCYARIWDILTLNSGADSHFCHSAYVTWSDVGLWSAHMIACLSNFCWRTSRLTKCVRQQKFERRAGMWADQRSTSDHLTWAEWQKCECDPEFNVKAGDTLSSRHVSSRDVRVQLGYLTLNCGAHSHFCHSAYVTWSDVELWPAHVPALLSNFCCRTHFVRRDERVQCSPHIVTSYIQKWRKCVLKKCANGPLYMKPNH
jgi:hypothetical protein